MIFPLLITAFVGFSSGSLTSQTVVDLFDISRENAPPSSQWTLGMRAPVFLVPVEAYKFHNGLMLTD